MTNLIQNYKIILEELINTCSHIKTTNQIRLPKLSDMELVALNITTEYMSINYEYNCLGIFQKRNWTEKLIEVSIKRKRRIFPYIEKIRETLSNKFSDFTNVLIVDSTSIESCKISRAKRSAICSTEDIKPSFGYCAAKKTRYLGFKLHAVCDTLL